MVGTRQPDGIVFRLVPIGVLCWPSLGVVHAARLVEHDELVQKLLECWWGALAWIGGHHQVGLRLCEWPFLAALRTSECLHPHLVHVVDGLWDGAVNYWDFLNFYIDF